MPTNLSSLSPLAQQARLNENAIAFELQYQGRALSLSYGDSLTLVQDIVLQLKELGLSSGSRLACLSHNSIEMALIYWACIESNILFCPISPKFALRQQQDLIDDFAITAYWSPRLLGLNHCQYINLKLNLTDTTKHSSLEPSPVNPELPVNLILTSGSSGSPKAAVHSLNNHIYSARGAASRISLGLADRWMLSLPLFHIGGLAILNRCALAGACVVFANEKQTVAEQCISDCITHLSLVEAQLIKLLELPKSLSSIKVLLLGGGAISPKYLNMLEQYPLRAFTSYGMTEMSSQICTGLVQRSPSGSIVNSSANKGSGKVLPHREVQIKERSIYVKGKTLFLGYLQPGIHTQMKLTLPLTEDGWFNTRDTGCWTQEGQLSITGRTDNMFICGGENIQPEEIETVLSAHPDIEKVIVFGKTDAKFGLLPAAIIKASNNCVIPKQAELDEYLADKLARFKRPRNYYSWPKNSHMNGLKVNRKQLLAERFKNEE